MADTKISALTAAAAALLAHEFAVNESGASKKVTAAQLKALIGTALKLAAGTASADTQPLEFASGTLLTTPEAGSMEYNGLAHYLTTPSGRGVAPGVLMRALNADAAGGNVATAQPWFPSAGAVAVQATTAYYFHGHISMARTAGTTAHTTSALFGGTATISNIGWFVEVKEGDAATISDSDLVRFAAAAGGNIKASSTVATENVVFGAWGVVWINAAGTFIPQFQFSAAPGGAPTIHKGTYFYLFPVSSGASAIQLGTWT